MFHTDTQPFKKYTTTLLTRLFLTVMLTSITFFIINDQEEYTIQRGFQRANDSESLALLGM